MAKYMMRSSGTDEADADTMRRSHGRTDSCRRNSAKYDVSGTSISEFEYSEQTLVDSPLSVAPTGRELHGPRPPRGSV